MEADISQLEAPTFTTITRGPPKPMLSLRWNHTVHLIGEKVLNPIIHTCEKCEKPIMIYGRMIPCRHVFCLSCAQAPRSPMTCLRCNEAVTRVEPTGLGTVFMCTHGGARHGTTGCKRTYLSQRDLMAHINHRHAPGGVQQPQPLPPPPKPPLHSPKPSPPTLTPPMIRKNNPHGNDPRVQTPLGDPMGDLPPAHHMGGFPPQTAPPEPPFNPYLTPPVPPHAFPAQPTPPPFFSPPVGVPPGVVPPPFAGPPPPLYPEGCPPPPPNQWSLPPAQNTPPPTQGFFHSQCEGHGGIMF
ncbi:hypothetical protein WDU94_004524 [Cyamophila willieti]